MRYDLYDLYMTHVCRHIEVMCSLGEVTGSYYEVTLE